jgi:hypothetical protein
MTLFRQKKRNLDKPGQTWTNLEKKLVEGSVENKKCAVKVNYCRAFAGKIRVVICFSMS